MADLIGVLEIDTWQDVLLPPAEMPLKPGQSRRGTEATAVVAHQIPTGDFQPAPEVVAQQKRVEAVEAQLRNHSAQAGGNPAALLRLQRRRQDLQAQLQDRQAKFTHHNHRHWQEFLDLIEILQHFGALEGLTLTPLGEVTAAVRGDNELWLGLALHSGALDSLDPHHLAAACAALVTEVSRPDSWSRYQLSEEVLKALTEVRSLRRQLFQLQRRRGVVLPIWLEFDLVGLVEQWALETPWTELCEQTSLDEGDLVRMLRRTLDFLSQIPHVPHLPPELKQNALRAIQLLNRFPVTEVL